MDTSRLHLIMTSDPPPHLPSSQVGPPPLEDDDSPGALITSLFRRLSFQSDLVDAYRALETALKVQKRRSEELEQKLCNWLAMTSPFVQFVQRRYEDSRTAWRECRAEDD